jgi:pyruvate kinase
MTATEKGQDLHFKKGQLVEVRLDDIRRVSTQSVLYLDYVALSNLISVNERLTFDGGLVAVVREIVLDEIRIEFQSEGNIRSQSPVRLEGKRYEFMPLLREEDKEAIQEAVKNHFDYIVLSAVTSAKDIQQARIELKNLNQRMGILSKVDTVEGLH